MSGECTCVVRVLNGCDGERAGPLTWHVDHLLYLHCLPPPGIYFSFGLLAYHQRHARNQHPNLEREDLWVKGSHVWVMLYMTPQQCGQKGGYLSQQSVSYSGPAAASGNWNWVNSNSRRPCFRQPRATPSPFGCSFKTSSLLVSYLGPSFQFCKQQQKQIELKPNNYTSLSEKEVSFIFLTGGSGGERLPNPEKGNGAHTILMGLSE